MGDESVREDVFENAYCFDNVRCHIMINKYENKLAQSLDSSIDLDHIRLGQEFFYTCLPLCVIDAVYSINSKYPAVQNAISRFSSRTGIKKYRPYGSSSIGCNSMRINEFLAFMDSYSDDDLAEIVFENRQRTSPTNGILKASAVRQFAQVLESSQVNCFEDIHHVLDNPIFEKRIKEIKGQKSGISLSYFYMLAGSEDMIKPDRHVVAYLQKYISQEIKSDNAIHYLREILHILKPTHPNLTLRHLDYAIWSCQSGRT